MKRQRAWNSKMSSVLLSLVLLLYGVTVDASNGSPVPCCFKLTSTPPVWLAESLVPVHGKSLKILGRVVKFGPHNIVVVSLYFIDKAEITETKEELLELSFTDKEFSSSDFIPGRTRVILIPLKPYNIYLPPTMFDLVKLPE